MIEPNESGKSFGKTDHGMDHLIVFKGVEENVNFSQSSFAELQDLQGFGTGDLVVTDVQVFQGKRGESTQGGEFVMTDIKFLDLIEFFELSEIGQVVVGKDKYFKIGELWHEREFLDFEIGKIGELQY